MQKKIYLFVLIICSISLGISVMQLFQNLHDGKVQENEIEELQAIVHNTESNNEITSKPQNADPLMIPEKAEPVKEIDTIDTEALQKLKMQNSDFIGWITIPGTEIDYPVMQSLNQDDFYLTHNFYKKFSKYGVPFIDQACDLIHGCDNIVIHGHHMKDGTMFAELTNYKDEDFYQEHRSIRFTTLTESMNFEIISVFSEQFDIIDDNSFLYHRFTKAKTRKEFDDFLKKVKEMSIYEISTTANYGDQLLTLSTCDQTMKEGRFVVVAKIVKE